MPVRELRVEDAAACDDIGSLPQFFGSEAGNGECARAVRTQPGWVAEVDGEPRAFLVIDHPLPCTRRSRGWPFALGGTAMGWGGRWSSTPVGELTASGAQVLSVLTLAASVPETATDT